MPSRAMTLAKKRKTEMKSLVVMFMFGTQLDV